ncbi:hypothetical protein BKA69DRAFT_1062941 [Paraphysoderma sedebokerense]|nr:hypothetical protein BKA69DRAFT_1062941 [Paraphysoderma sedebokerense]
MSIVFYISEERSKKTDDHDNDHVIKGSGIWIWEWVFYGWTGLYMLEMIKEYAVVGFSFYFMSFWNSIETVSFILLTGAFVTRIVALSYHAGSPQYETYNNSAELLLSADAVFLWMRLLSIFDRFRFFGNLLIILQSMLRNAMAFFVLLVFVFLGFITAFMSGTGKPFSEVIFVLVQGLLLAPDFQAPKEWDPLYGSIMYTFFVSIVGVVLLNLLIAVFNDSYTKIVENADQEYFIAFTIKTLSFFEQTRRYPFLAPFNIFEIVLVPVSYILPQKVYNPIQQSIYVVANFPFILAASLWEYLEPSTVDIETSCFLKQDQMWGGSCDMPDQSDSEGDSADKDKKKELLEDALDEAEEEALEKEEEAEKV